MGKFFNSSLYFVAGRERPFYHYKDALDYCNENNLSNSAIDKFDSKKEYERYKQLLELQEKGLISDLKRQVRFVLVPDQKEKVHVKDKVVKCWQVNGANNSIVYFMTKKAALGFCRDNGVSKYAITKTERIEPVYREKTIEKQMVYTADFVYCDLRHQTSPVKPSNGIGGIVTHLTTKSPQNGLKPNLVVEDVKSKYTAKESDYVIRRKLMLYFHGIRIKEVIF